jgi:hypothetical protein
MLWLLFAIALLLFALAFRESYQDPDSPVTRPTGDRKKDQAWYSKIDSQAPIDGDDAAYIRVITQFYDEVYEPAETRPTKTELDAFVAKLPAPFNPPENAAGTPNANHKAIVEILETGFRIGRAGTAAAREQQELVTTGALAGFKGENLQPSDGYDAVYGHRTQDLYVPADNRPAVEFSEGEYDPTPQTEPTRPGEPDPREGSWTGVRFFSLE